MENQNCKTPDWCIALPKDTFDKVVLCNPLSDPELCFESKKSFHCQLFI